MPLTLHLPGIALDLAVLGSKTLSKILCEKFCGNFQTQKNKETLSTQLRTVFKMKLFLVQLSLS